MPCTVLKMMPIAHTTVHLLGQCLKEFRNIAVYGEKSLWCILMVFHYFKQIEFDIYH